ncbi:MAG: hypothetical protein QOJ99_2 [Bryobacterales bacterium]|nr:hypothetical protein [Bryobacterales bacterium]
MIEQSRIGSQIRPRRTSDRLLVNLHEAPNRFRPLRDLAARGKHWSSFQFFDFILRSDLMSEPFREQFHQELDHQSRLTGTGNTGDAGKYPQWKSDIQVVQIVARRTSQTKPALGRAGCPAGRPV